MPESMRQNVMRRAASQITFTQEPVPGRELYTAVRAALMLNGETLKSWSEQRGHDRSWTYMALMGTTDSEAARELRRELVAYAGLAGAAA